MARASICESCILLGSLPKKAAQRDSCAQTDASKEEAWSANTRRTTSKAVVAMKQVWEAFRPLLEDAASEADVKLEVPAGDALWPPPWRTMRCMQGGAKRGRHKNRSQDVVVRRLSMRRFAMPCSPFVAPSAGDLRFISGLPECACATPRRSWVILAPPPPPTVRMSRSTFRRFRALSAHACAPHARFWWAGDWRLFSDRFRHFASMQCRRAPVSWHVRADRFFLGLWVSWCRFSVEPVTRWRPEDCNVRLPQLGASISIMGRSCGHERRRAFALVAQRASAAMSACAASMKRHVAMTRGQDGHVVVRRGVGDRTLHALGSTCSESPEELHRHSRCAQA